MTDGLVMTSGVYDLLHVGHLGHLQFSRAQGLMLVVLLNDDASVRRRKGADRPVVPQHERRALLESLRCVDRVIVCDADEQAEKIALYQPSIFCVGPDYTADQVVGREIFARYGGRVVVTPRRFPHSTTARIGQCKSLCATKAAVSGFVPENTGGKTAT